MSGSRRAFGYLPVGLGPQPLWGAGSFSFRRGYSARPHGGGAAGETISSPIEDSTGGSSRVS